MAIELKNILDSEVEVEIKKDTNKTQDLTLIIGKDYPSLSFYEKIKAINE